MKKRRKINRNWSYRFRKINGVRRRVKVRKVGNRYRVRVVGHRNRTDTIYKRKRRARRRIW